MTKKLDKLCEVMFLFSHTIKLQLAALDSISSMEVNVDFLELTDHMDMFEQEALDIFLSSGGAESDQPSPLAGELWFPCTYVLSIIALHWYIQYSENKLAFHHLFP